MNLGVVKREARLVGEASVAAPQQYRVFVEEEPFVAPGGFGFLAVGQVFEDIGEPAPTLHSRTTSQIPPPEGSICTAGFASTPTGMERSACESAWRNHSEPMNLENAAGICAPAFT